VTAYAKRSLRARITPFVLTTTLLTGVFATVTPTAASAAPIDSAVISASAYATEHGVSNGIAVVDDVTGKLYAAGHYATYYGTASVVKVFMASWLLSAGKMSGSNETSAYSMITASDNNAYVTLLRRCPLGLPCKLGSE
jgi:D-alanyl-D-alanine carboxypeptidase